MPAQVGTLHVHSPVVLLLLLLLLLWCAENKLWLLADTSSVISLVRTVGGQLGADTTLDCMPASVTPYTVCAGSAPLCSVCVSACAVLL